MAKYKAADIVQTGNSRLPRENYIWRIVDEVAKTSSSGNEMIQYDLELLGCVQDDGTVSEVIKIDGAQVNIAGRTCSFYLTMTPNSMGRVLEHFRSFGVDVDDESFELDTENPFENEALQLKGSLIYAVSSSEASPVRRELTAEERAAGKNVGEILKHPVTGKPMEFHRPKIERMCGFAEINPGDIVKTPVVN